MISVFLVDDHQLFLSGVRAELGDAVDVVGSASEVDAAIEMIRDRARCGARRRAHARRRRRARHRRGARDASRIRGSLRCR